MIAAFDLVEETSTLQEHGWIPLPFPEQAALLETGQNWWHPLKELHQGSGKRRGHVLLPASVPFSVTQKLLRNGLGWSLWSLLPAAL